MKETIWFVSHYSMPPQYEMRIKTQMYAHILNGMGYRTLIFSASTLHNTDINLIQGNEEYVRAEYEGLSFVHIKCRNYHGNGLGRILNMQEFAHKFEKYASNFESPDVVIADVNCTNYTPILRFCKKRGIPMYVDIRDLWPMSIVDYLDYSANNPIIKYLYHREKEMYKRVDGAFFVMEGWKEYLKDRKWADVLDLSKFHWIGNGVDYDSFSKQITENVYEDEELDSPDLYKVVYAGSIRVANDVEPLIRAAKLLQDNKKGITVFLFGDGDDSERLKSIVESEGITNVRFKGFVEKKYIPNILSRADLCVLNYKKANSSKYGASQNKLFEYLAVGKPILMTVDINYNLVTRYDVGLALEAPDPVAIANGIIHLADLNSDEVKSIKMRAQGVAQQYDYKELTSKLLDVILRKDKKNI